jgi:polysaccharide transporter, PST family
MKKNSYQQGAFIATFGIFITRAIGILFMIPFYLAVGEQGGALYGYAYNIYLIFLSLSSVGIPLAMSKIISEYNTLGYYYIKEKTFGLGKRVIFVMCLTSFFLVFCFAPQIAYLIIGDIKGGNTMSDVVFVIRIVSFAILIVPSLSVSRGYLQGQKYIAVTTASQVIEQIARVGFILIGSFIALNIFKMSLTNVVGIAVFGAFVGGLASYIYLLFKIRKNRNLLKRDEEINQKEKNITSNSIIKKLIMYSTPFVIVDLSKSLYNSIDMITLVKTLVKGLNYKVTDAESIMSIISTWGASLNMIVVSVAMGIITSLIPNLTSSFVKNDMVDVRNKITKTLQILLYISIPMSVGLSFLAKPVWTAFYGNDSWGPIIFNYSIYITIFLTLFTTITVILQSLNKYKIVYICLIIAFSSKLLFNIPLIYLFNKLNMNGAYGAITSTIIGYLLAIIIFLIYMRKVLDVKYNDTLKNIIKIIFAIFIMIVGMSLLKLLIPLEPTSRLTAMFIIIIYSLIGSAIYIFITYKNKIISDIFGNELINKILKKIKIKKVA